MLHRLRQIFRPDADTLAAEFWALFAANEAVFRTLPHTSPAEIKRNLKLLEQPLHAFHPYLGILFGHPGDDRHELIVTAHSEPRHFPAADALVAAAPVIPNWNVHALRPPMPADTTVHVDEHGFVPALVTFAVVRVPQEPEALALHVFHEAYPTEQQDLHDDATALLLEAVLGERALARVRYVQTRPMSAEVPANVLRPLRSLPQVVLSQKQ